MSRTSTAPEGVTFDSPEIVDAWWDVVLAEEDTGEMEQAAA